MTKSFKKNHKEKDAKKLIMAFGTFDIFHAGHEDYLKQAKSLGDELLVIIARDNTVKSVKGKSPDNDEKKRLRRVRQNQHVDKALLGNFDNKHKVILKHRPDVIALGYDQFVFTQTIEKTLIDANINAEIVRMKAFQPQVYKSSLLKKNISE